ncbi:hypothetical protein ACW9H6_23925 [Pseudomonas sp. SDO528_S397]
MEVIGSETNKASINITRAELLVINAALNEVCNGIEVFEFETRIGVDKTCALGILGEVGRLLDRMDA